jgi:hypothetical protein
MAKGKLLDRTFRLAHAAAGRPVRLRQNQSHIVAGGKQRRQRERCELRSAGKN